MTRIKITKLIEASETGKVLNYSLKKSTDIHLYWCLFHNFYQHSRLYYIMIWFKKKEKKNTITSISSYKNR